MTDITRDAFEAQICSQFPNIMGGVLTERNKSGNYSSLVVHHAYLVWQAATEQGKRQPFSYERDSALCEANCNAESDAFFAARPALDSDASRRIFYAGHRRAWINYPALFEATNNHTTRQP